MAITYNFENDLDRAGLPRLVRRELQDILSRNLKLPIGKTRVTNSVLSVKTQRSRALNIIRALRDIYFVGKFEIESVYSLKEKHVNFLIDDWVKAEQTLGTIENKITYLKTFCSWIGKVSLIKKTATYRQLEALPARSGVALKDKSWSAAGVDADKVIAGIDHENPFMAMQLRLQLTFGLRTVESFLIRPKEIVYSEAGVPFITLRSGTKGGRPRDLYLTEPHMLEVLQLAGSLANRRTGSMIPESVTLKEWEKKWKAMMQRHGLTTEGLGVTPHGLRHQRFNDMFEKITGHESAVRGGTMPPKEIHQYARKVIAETAGHTRVSKSNAYCGSYRVQKTQHSKSLTNEQIITALEECGGSRTNAALKLRCARSYLYLRLNEMKTASIAFPPAQPNALSGVVG